jgi:membrane-associated protease RseP (regulator of RpoE activity)
MTDSATRRRVWVNGVLFALTVVSTFVVGLGLSLSYLYPNSTLDQSPAAEPGLQAFLEPRVLFLALLYSGVLMIILVGHELGHYLTCRRYGLEATLPYFIPAPNIIGTFGAFIKIKSPISRKQELFDVGAAGPLAGFVLALPALLVGLACSKVVPFPSGEGSLSLGEPMLLKLAAGLFFGHIPAGADIVLHPVGFAGWVGLLVTALNLFPVGQLDGGHVAYALVGRKRKFVSSTALGAFLVLGVFFFVGWFVWGIAGLLFVLVRRTGRPRPLHRLAIRLKHPPVQDEDVPLGRGRTILAAIVIAIFILSFIPDPIKGYSLLALLSRAGAGVK